jgi:hypothetical protein
MVVYWFSQKTGQLAGVMNGNGGLGNVATQDFLVLSSLQ